MTSYTLSFSTQIPTSVIAHHLSPLFVLLLLFFQIPFSRFTHQSISPIVLILGTLWIKSVGASLYQVFFKFKLCFWGWGFAVSYQNVLQDICGMLQQLVFMRQCMSGKESLGKETLHVSNHAVIQEERDGMLRTKFQVVDLVGREAF